MDRKIEEWRAVVGYEGLYEVSSFGRVRSIDRVITHNNKKGMKSYRQLKGKTLKLGKDGHGYNHVNLGKNGVNKFKSVHRMVAEAFIPKIDGKNYVNHIDSNPLNNKVENLEWCTSSENNIHGWRSGSRIATNAKKVNMYTKDMDFIKTFNSIAEAGRCTGICENDIRACCNKPDKCKSAGGYKWRLYSKDVCQNDTAQF